jgi:hypothetical protein
LQFGHLDSETLRDWDEVEDVIFLLLSRPAGEIDATVEG